MKQLRPENTPAYSRFLTYLLCLAAGGLAYWLVPGEESQKYVAAVFAVTVGLWITEALPLAVTALLGTTFLVVFGTMSAGDAFSQFGSTVILLFIGSFLLAKAMEVSGLARRFAFFFLRQKWVSASDAKLLLGLGLVACLMSQFVSNTATAAMMLPVTMTLINSLGESAESGSSDSLLLMTTWGSSVAVGTVVATPPNMIGLQMIRDQGIADISFVGWMGFGLPVSGALLLVAWLYLRKDIKKGGGFAETAHRYAMEQSKVQGKLTPRERNVLIGFGLAIFLWMTPGLVQMTMGTEHPLAEFLSDRFPSAVAALLGAGLLFILPCKDTDSGQTFTWEEAKTIDWGTIMLFAGGLALGKAVFDSGLAQMLGDWVATFTGHGNPWVVMALCMVMACVVSETASNTASATIMVPIAIAISQGAGVSPVAPALGTIFAASLGFMFPVSTPPNAIVFSTGRIKMKTMMAKGFWFDILALATAFLLLRFLLPAMGLV